MMVRRTVAMVAGVVWGVSVAPVVAGTGEGATLRLPPCVKAPVIDGTMRPGEWDGAFMGTGHLSPRGQLQRRRVHYWLTYDTDRVYVALRSELPPWGTLEAKKRRIEAQVGKDHHIEIFLDPWRGPNPGDRTSYQFMGNPLGSIFDMGRNPAYGAVVPYTGDWQFRNTVKDGWWTAELATRAADLNGGMLTPGGVWGVNFCMKWMDPYEYSGWPSRVFFNRADYLKVTLDPDAPVVRLTDLVGLGTDEVHASVRMTNTAKRQVTYKVTAALEADGKEAHAAKSIAVAAGQTGQVGIPVTQRVGKANRFRLTVTSPDGSQVYFRDERTFTGQRRGKAWVKAVPVASARRAAVWVDAMFYPGTARVRARLGFETYKQADRVAAARVTVSGPGGDVVARSVVSRFEDRTADHLVDLPRPLRCGRYQVSVRLLDRDARMLSGLARDTFEKKRFPFEGNSLGLSDAVLPPWTPLVVRGTGIACWGRQHQRAADGLLQQITTQGHAILSRPIHWSAVAGGKTLRWRPRFGGYTRNRPHVVEWQAETHCDKVAIRARTHVEYDGMFKYEVELTGRGDGAVDRLDLVVPLKARYATLLHATSDGCRTNYAGRVPPGTGRVWDSTRVQQWVLTGTFIPYIWAGTERFGLCWWADKDAGWVRPAGRRDPAVEVVRDGDEVRIVFHIIARPFKLTTPRRLTFAFEATPVRPRPSWARRVNVSYANRMPGGPDYEFCGSTAWCLGWTDKYRDWPYTFAHIMPVNAECRDALRRRVAEIGRRGRRLFAYTDLTARSFATDEARYYAWEWARQGDAFTKAEIAARKPYQSFRVNFAPSRIDFDLWALNEDMDLGVAAFLFDEIQAAGQRNPGAGLGYVADDGYVEGECSLFGMREYVKRVYTLMMERGDPEPLVCMHTTSTLYAGPLAFATMCIGFENNNRDPARRQLLMYGLPYVRAENACLQYGMVGSVCPRDRSSVPDRYRNYFGVQLLHDMRFSWSVPGGASRDRLAAADVLAAFGTPEPDCEFVGYWEAGDLYEVAPDTVKVSVYHRPSTGRAVLVAVNTVNQTQTLRWRPTSRFGSAGPLTDVLDAKSSPRRGADGFWTVAIKPYDFRLLSIGAGRKPYWSSRPWLKPGSPGAP